jgi:hypothetical protein
VYLNNSNFEILKEVPEDSRKCENQSLEMRARKHFDLLFPPSGRFVADPPIPKTVREFADHLNKQGYDVHLISGIYIIKRRRVERVHTISRRISIFSLKCHKTTTIINTVCRIKSNPRNTCALNALREFNASASEAIGGQSAATAIGGQSAATAIGGQSVATAIGGQSAATAIGGQSAATAIGGQSAATAIGGQSAATAIGGQSVATAIGGQSEATAIGGQSAATAIGGQGYRCFTSVYAGYTVDDLRKFMDPFDVTEETLWFWDWITPFLHVPCRDIKSYTLKHWNEKHPMYYITENIIFDKLKMVSKQAMETHLTSSFRVVEEHQAIGTTLMVNLPDGNVFHGTVDLMYMKSGRTTYTRLKRVNGVDYLELTLQNLLNAQKEHGFYRSTHRDDRHDRNGTLVMIV